MIVFVGTYQESYSSPVECTVLALEGSMSARQARQVLQSEAAAYLADEGRELDFDYNFGDIIDLTYEDGFVRRMEAAGLRIAENAGLDMEVFEHDDIWISRDDIR